LLVVLFLCCSADSPWDPALKSLENNGTNFHESLEILTNATILSYTATFGSYYNPTTTNGSLSGWKRSPIESNPSGNLKHVLIFKMVYS
jgi:hypothetical protein